MTTTRRPEKAHTWIPSGLWCPTCTLELSTSLRCAGCGGRQWTTEALDATSAYAQARIDGDMPALALRRQEDWRRQPSRLRCLYALTANTGHTFTVWGDRPTPEGDLPASVVAWIRNVWLPGISSPTLNAAQSADVEMFEPLVIGRDGPLSGNVATWIAEVRR